MILIGPINAIQFDRAKMGTYESKGIERGVASPSFA